MTGSGQLPKAVRGMTLVGTALLLGFVCLAMPLLIATFDTHGRVFGYRARPYLGWLVILWVFFATVLAGLRWKSTNVKFRLVFAVNFFIACLLVYSLVAR